MIFRGFIMFASLRPDFNLKQLVTFIVALWLQVTALVIFCGLSSKQMSPSNRVDAPRVQVVNGTYAMEAHSLAAAMPLRTLGQ
jgi:hypothetical protein